MSYTSRHLQILLATLITILIIVVGNEIKVSLAQDANNASNLNTLILKLNNTKAGFYVVFKTSVIGSDSWSVPETFEDKSGNIIGKRVLGEIGSDYFCTDEINQGYTSQQCVPFDNIAYISSP